MVGLLSQEKMLNASPIDSILKAIIEYNSIHVRYVSLDSTRLSRSVVVCSTGIVGRASPSEVPVPCAAGAIGL